MNQIVTFGDKLTADEYVRIIITSSRGKRSVCSKEELAVICEKGGVKPTWNDTKESIYDKIVANQIYSGKELAKMFHVGISGRIYAQHFKIPPQMVYKLESGGIIHRIGTGESYDCGKKYREPLYDAYEYEAMNPDTIRKFYMEHRIESNS